jgi:hypothetical protein
MQDMATLMQDMATLMQDMATWTCAVSKLKATARVCSLGHVLCTRYVDATATPGPLMLGHDMAYCIHVWVKPASGAFMCIYSSRDRYTKVGRVKRRFRHDHRHDMRLQAQFGI